MSKPNAQGDDTKVVQFAVAAWFASAFGGYRKTTESDITAAGGKMPNTGILTKGGKHIFPAHRLAKFNTIKKNLLRELLKFGVRSFGSGSAVAFHVEQLPAAEALLKKAKDDYADAIVDLRANYDKWLAEFIAAEKNPAAQEIIRKSALSADDACSKFGFGFDVFVPSPIGEDCSVESMADKLLLQLYEEVAQTADEAYNRSFAPADSQGNRQVRRVAQRAKWPLKSCKEKLEKLEFLSPDIKGAVKAITYVLGKTPDNGYINDEPNNPAHTRLIGLVTLMMDAHRFASVASKVAASANPEVEIDKFCGVEAATQVAVAKGPEVQTELPIVTAAATAPSPAEAPVATQKTTPEVAATASHSTTAQVPTDSITANPAPTARRRVVTAPPMHL